MCPKSRRRLKRKVSCLNCRVTFVSWNVRYNRLCSSCAKLTDQLEVYEIKGVRNFNEENELCIMNRTQG